jgi:hypothetical protein
MTEPPVLPCNISNSWVIPSIQGWAVVLGVIITLATGVSWVATKISDDRHFAEGVTTFQANALAFQTAETADRIAFEKVTVAELAELTAATEHNKEFVDGTIANEAATAAKLTELSAAVNRLNYNYCMADGHHQCDSNGEQK